MQNSHAIRLQYFSILITIISPVVVVGVSYVTSTRNEAQIKGLTFATASAEDKALTRASWGAGEVMASQLVVAFIIGAYVYFCGLLNAFSSSHTLHSAEHHLFIHARIRKR